MATDDEVSLADVGRERLSTTLRARIYWALVGLCMVVAAPSLAVSGTATNVWVILGALVAASIAAIWVSDYLMTPVYALRQRLEVKNYGERESDPTANTELDLGAGGLEFGAILSSLPGRRVDLTVGLPVELAAIERMARAGRVSELAMASVKRDLFRHLSHQLKSPLAMIRAHAQLAAHSIETDGDNPLPVRSALTEIEAISLNTSGLIETMLSLGWIEGQEGEGVGREKANVSALMMELIGFRERSAGDRSIRIEANVEAGLWVRGQAQLIQEMFACLVDNSLRYGPPSSVVLVDEHRLPGSLSVIVSVTDRGPGIPVQERERVFEPFYGSIGVDDRGHMTFGNRRQRALGAGADKKSHGLGLALVRAVAKLHGASVSLASGPGNVGLCARVILCASEPPRDTQETSGQL